MTRQSNDVNNQGMNYPSCSRRIVRSAMFLQCCELGAKPSVHSQGVLAGDSENYLNLLHNYKANMPWELSAVK